MTKCPQGHPIKSTLDVEEKLLFTSKANIQVIFIYLFLRKWDQREAILKKVGGFSFDKAISANQPTSSKGNSYSGETEGRLANEMLK